VSYIAAGFLGPLYVLYRRSGGVLQAAGIAAGLTLGIVVLTGVTSFLPARTQLAAILVAVPAALVAQSTMVIGIIRRSYRRRGWMVRLG